MHNSIYKYASIQVQSIRRLNIDHSYNRISDIPKIIGYSTLWTNPPRFFLNISKITKKKIKILQFPWDNNNLEHRGLIRQTIITNSYTTPFNDQISGVSSFLASQKRLPLAKLRSARESICLSTSRPF